MRVGFIGLGDQGAPMAAAIAGEFHLTVWARNEKSLEALRGSVYEKKESAAAVAAAVDVLCLCLRGDDDIQNLVRDGLLRDTRNLKVVVNHATGDPREAAELARLFSAAGSAFLDAPVSGGTSGSRGPQPYLLRWRRCRRARAGEACSLMP